MLAFSYMKYVGSVYNSPKQRKGICHEDESGYFRMAIRGGAIMGRGNIFGAKKQASGQKDLAGIVFCRSGNISVQPVPCVAISTADHDKYRIPESL